MDNASVCQCYMDLSSDMVLSSSTFRIQCVQILYHWFKMKDWKLCNILLILMAKTVRVRQIVLKSSRCASVHTQPGDSLCWYSLIVFFLCCACEPLKHQTYIQPGIHQLLRWYTHFQCTSAYMIHFRGTADSFWRFCNITCCVFGI